MIYEISSLHERIYRFLLGNALVGNAGQFSRLMHRHRTYFSTLRRAGRQPSRECWDYLSDHLRDLLARQLQPGTRDAISQFLDEIAAKPLATGTAKEVEP